MKRVFSLIIITFLLAGLIGVQQSAAQSSTSVTTAATIGSGPPPSMLSNVELRKAVSYCTDKAALVQSVYPLLSPAQVADLVRDSYVSPISWAYKSPTTTYPYNPAAGQAILDTQGWLLAPGDTYRKNAQGKELVIGVTTTTAQFRKTYLAVFEAQMAACGIDVVRSHVSGLWFFGETSGLARRDFETAVFAWISSTDPVAGALDLYACFRTPAPSYNWMGQNFSGWCNLTADDAIKTAVNTFDKATQKTALATVQDALGADVPSLPLFARMNIYAYNKNLTGFSAFEGDDYYSSNAYQWGRSGRTTLYWGMASEPTSLLSVKINNSPLIQAAMGAAYTTPNFNPTPLLQSTFSTIGSGATNTTVSVSSGQKVVDAYGYTRTLASGVKVRDASGDVITYTGGTVSMKQMTVDYTYLTGLEWNDGIEVSQADFQLGYDISCNPATDWYNSGGYCGLVKTFTANAHGYQITWLPGYQSQSFTEAPFPYFPAHRPILSTTKYTGDTLADVLPVDWEWLEEVNRTPWSAGPYYVSSWVSGNYIELTKNDHSKLGTPATANIRVMFLANPEAAVIADTVDVVGAESLFALTSNLNNATNIYRKILPSITWEHLDFNFNYYLKTFLPVTLK